MKYSQFVAIAALLGLVDVTSGFDVMEKNNQDKLFVQMKFLEEDDSSDEEKEEANMVQTNKILEKAQGWGGWAPHMEEFPGTQNEFGNWVDPYERKVPTIFTGDSAESATPPVDKFTQNLIKNYAFEAATGPDKDGKTAFDAHHPLPSGAFLISKTQGKLLAEEVLCTHYKKCGADATAWLDEFSGEQRSFGTRWEEAWNYWDVLKAGKIDAVGASVLYRHLCKPLGNLDLQ